MKKNTTFLSFLPKEITQQISYQEAFFQQKKAFFIELNPSFSLQFKILMLNQLNSNYIAISTFINSKLDAKDALKQFSKIKNLKAIWFIETDPKYLTDDWAKLSNLEAISFATSRLNAIPTFLEKLPNLQYLDLGYKKHSDFPVVMQHSKTYQTLDQLRGRLKNKPFPIYLGKNGLFSKKGDEILQQDDHDLISIFVGNLKVLEHKYEQIATNSLFKTDPYFSQTSMNYLGTVVLEKIKSLKKILTKRNDFIKFKKRYLKLLSPLSYTDHWKEEDYISWANYLLKPIKQTIDWSEYDLDMLQQLLLTEEEENTQST